MKLKCSHCGGEFEVPEDVNIATCPYCGTTFEISTGKLESKHYFYPMIYDSNEAYETLKAILIRQFGIPSDFKEKVSLISRHLHYLPIYIFYVEGKAECEGTEILEAEYVAIPSMRILPIPIPAEYRFPIKGRVYFKPQMLKYGKFYSPQLKIEHLEKYAKARVYRRISGEVELACPKAEVTLNCKCEGLTHYPIWELQYVYAGFKLRGVVDAVSGEVFSAQYPMSTFHRGMAIGMSLSILASGMAIGWMIGQISSHPLIGIIGGIIPAVAGALHPLRKSAYKIQEYRSQTHGELMDESGTENVIKEGLKIVSLISNFNFKLQ
ncbi:MAG: hypothetical protein DRJ30_00690 [Candidatus Methanomethylicota archaeon]|nr:MAG: hypothetical protein DRJ30_00690 [Candidatus Verstraetearchaeota archaeon]